MQTHDLIPNTPDWHAFRATHRGASDAPVMMGCSPHKTRAQLLHEKFTGMEAEHSSFVQDRVLAPGHAFEALARPLAAEIIGEALYPCVGSDGLLSATFDGLTMGDDVDWEHKRLNDELRAILPAQGFGKGADLPLLYRVQLEQQCMVSGAGRALFTASEWDGDTLMEARHAWYDSDANLAQQIRAGWAQFEADLAAYTPPAAAPVVVAAAAPSLPAVSVRMDGALTVASNLPEFATALRAFIERIPVKPSTDQEFADTDAACKALKRAEEALEAAESNALASMSSVEAMRRVVADCRALARATRLEREKMVEARKLEIRTEEVQRGKAALAKFIEGLTATIGKPYMPASASQVDFAGAIKGLRSLDSVRAAIDQRLAEAKIAANEIAGTIAINLRALRELAADKPFLFSDTATLVLKAPDDCKAVITSRLAEHQRAEEKRLADERERIRVQEEAKARKRLEDEQRASLEAAAAAQRAAAAPPPAPAPMAATPAVVPLRRAPAPASTPTLTLGTIATRLGFSVPAAFLATLGFEPAGRERSAVLYHEADFPRICDALIARIQEARQPLAA